MRCEDSTQTQIRDTNRNYSEKGAEIKTYKIMDLKLNNTSNMSTKLLQDIASYQQLLQRSDLEDDIPPRRFSGTKAVRKPVKKTQRAKRKPLTKYVKAESPCLLLQRPTYFGKPGPEPPIPRTTPQRRQTRRQTQIVKKQKEREDCLSRVNRFDLRKEKTLLWQNAVDASVQGSSFEQKILRNHTYEGLIKCIRERVDDIDFGLLSRFLPKNLELEKQRFHIDYPADYGQLYSRGSVFSDDIDHFFKQLSDSIPRNETTYIPLV